jgi:hypothetical protein
MPKVTCEPVGLRLASPEIVRLPNPKVTWLGVGISTIESAVTPGFPILKVSVFLVTEIVTLVSAPDVENGKAAKESNPNNIYNP